jgi:hypothetical protein
MRARGTKNPSQAAIPSNRKARMSPASTRLPMPKPNATLVTFGGSVTYGSVFTVRLLLASCVDALSEPRVHGSSSQL